MDTESTLRTLLRRLVLAVFACAAVLIVVLVGVVVLSAAGLSFDPHGYGMFAGILCAAVLLPVALALWLLYRSMRRRSVIRETERPNSPGTTCIPSKCR